MKNKILVVDDEPLIVELLKDELELEGYEVLTSSSGNQAIDILVNDNSIDLIITDSKMPDGTGIDILNSVEKFACRPIIFMISGETDTSIDELYRLGLNKFFAKPYDGDLLIESIANALKEKKAQS